MSTTFNFTFCPLRCYLGNNQTRSIPITGSIPVGYVVNDTLPSPSNNAVGAEGFLGNVYSFGIGFPESVINPTGSVKITYLQGCCFRSGTFPLELIDGFLVAPTFTLPCANPCSPVRVEVTVTPGLLT
jgi:hypothetical protein